MVEGKQAVDENMTLTTEESATQQPQVLEPLSSGETTSHASSSQKKIVASGTTGAVVGFLFGGPILSALLGFGAAYAAQKEGAPGDVARALGDMGISVRDKAVEVDEKHHIVERSTKVANDAWEEAKKYDQTHNVLDKTKDFTVDTWQSIINFVQERRILQRGVDGFGQGYEFVAKKIGFSATNGESTNSTTPSGKT